jgi:hypothetical protein
MEKAITTIMLTVAGIVAIVTVINALMPAISRTNGSIVASADSVDSRISTSIEIIHASGSDGSTEVEAWAKNVGGIAVAPLNRIDVFFGPANSFVRISPGAEGCTSPCWYYTVENDTSWTPTATLRVSISLDDALVTGTTYYLKVVAPNGISDARFFTV